MNNDNEKFIYFDNIATTKPDDRVIAQCKRRGQRIAELTLKMSG